MGSVILKYNFIGLKNSDFIALLFVYQTQRGIISMKIAKTLTMTVMAAFLAGGFYSYASSHPVVVEFGQEQIQQSVQNHLPIHKNLVLGVASLDLNSVNVSLDEQSDRVSVLLNGTVKALDKTYSGQIQASFGLEYNLQNSQIYLTHPEVTSIQFEGLPELASKSLTKLVLPLIQANVEQISVYQLKDNASFQQTLIHKTLKKIDVDSGKIQVLLGL